MDAATPKEDTAGFAAELTRASVSTRPRSSPRDGAARPSTFAIVTGRSALLAGERSTNPRLKSPGDAGRHWREEGPSTSITGTENAPNVIHEVKAEGELCHVMVAPFSYGYEDVGAK
jgi:hypothetical protein